MNRKLASIVVVILMLASLAACKYDKDIGWKPPSSTASSSDASIETSTVQPSASLSLDDDSTLTGKVIAISGRMITLSLMSERPTDPAQSPKAAPPDATSGPTLHSGLTLTDDSVTITVPPEAVILLLAGASPKIGTVDNIKRGDTLFVVLQAEAVAIIAVIAVDGTAALYESTEDVQAPDALSGATPSAAPGSFPTTAPDAVSGATSSAAPGSQPSYEHNDDGEYEDDYDD